jgi:hypothetical protein
MSMSNAAQSTEAAKFIRSAKRVMRQIETYATTGGDCLEATRTEVKLAAARDRLEDTLRPLGLESDAACLALMGQVKQACRDCGDRAAAARRAANNAEIARINAEIADAREAAERRNPGAAAFLRELRLAAR